jgi:hypothetical protein
VRPAELATGRGEKFLSFVDAAGTGHEGHPDRIRSVPGPQGDATVEAESAA